MILIFVECAESLRVYDYDWGFVFSILRAVKYFFPEPQTLSARLNRGSNLKTANLLFLNLHLFKEQFIEQVGLACAILAAYRYDRELLLRQ